VRRNDVLVGIAASGVTPFVESGLRTAARLGARTVLVTCNPRRLTGRIAEVLIAPDVGPELLTGSTRLKAGTATKLVLNMLTVATMVQLGKVYGHWMVDVRPTSRKLRARALRIIQTVAGVTPRHAAAALRRSGGQVKAAIVMASLGLNRDEALALLATHGGALRRAMPTPPTRRTALV
jgi:N-acetylmuramic acid 6-phosphate etherase